MAIKKKFKKAKMGRYIPKNMEKYIGRDLPITRSSWERKMCQWLDCNPNIIQWSSESNTVPYYDPIQMKNRRYYPDFFIKVKDTNGNMIKYLIEVKPEKETKPPTHNKKYSKKTKLWQEATYATNIAKWEAAKKYCHKLGYKFMIITEKELFKK